MATEGDPTPGDRKPEGKGRAARLPALGSATTWAAVAAVIVLFGLVGFFLLSSGAGDGRGPGGAQGVPAPDLSLDDFDDQTFTLAEYRGRPVVVNFWASWCPFCIAEMPDFEKVHQSVKDKVEFVGIAQRDNFQAAQDLAEETGVTYRLVRDPEGRAYDAIAKGAMPTTAFIDEEGNIVEVVGGQLTEQQLRELISSHFGVSG